MKSAVFLALTALLLTPAAMAEPEVKHALDLTVPAAGVKYIVVELPVSSIEIVSGEGRDIHATGVVKREYDGTAEMARAQKIVDAASLDLTLRGDRLVVRKKFGADARSRSARGSNTRYVIRLAVPRGVALEIRQRVGEVKIDGEFGDIDIDLRVGDVSVNVPRASVGELSARTRIGDVTTNLGDRIVQREGILAGTTHFLNEGGRSKVKIAMTVGEIRVNLK